jgi:hypothetical protein
MIKKFFDVGESHRKSLKLIHNATEILANAKRIADHAPEDRMNPEVLERHHRFQRKVDQIYDEVRMAYEELADEEGRH